jgi:hypothetical protein
MRNRVLAWWRVEPDVNHSPVPGALPLNATGLAPVMILIEPNVRLFGLSTVLNMDIQ